MLAYTTGPGPRRGWDAFDAMVLWAVAQRPRQTFDEIAALLPAGVSYHLIHNVLRLAEGGGLIVRVVASITRYQVTPAGQYRLACTTSPGHQAAA